ncbi:MAG: FtsQ-type POTRA domain-containing protein [Clostridia bacterium]|nr:FtsQ-type POTRA domain-containing protein [Clostridia bacterium]
MNIIHKKKNVNKNINKDRNKSKRADSKSAHRPIYQMEKSYQNIKREPIDLDNEIIIGIPNIDNRLYKDKTSNKKNNMAKNNVNKTRKANVKSNKIKKQRKLSEKQIKRRRFILKILKWISLGLIIIGIIICIILSPIFNIKNIKVKNNNKISYEQIVSLSSIQINNNTFKYSKNDIKNKIKENAYIEEVKVKRLLPDVFEIEVKERTARLMLLFGNAYVYINSQGYILEISNENINLPIIKGYKTEEENIIPGKRLCNEDLEKLSVVLKIIEFSQSEQILDKITGIDVEDEYDYKIIMEREQKIAHLGNCSMLEERILWVKTILNEIKDLPGDIFVNMNLNSERIEPFFRERV